MGYFVSKNSKVLLHFFRQIKVPKKLKDSNAVCLQFKSQFPFSKYLDKCII